MPIIEQPLAKSELIWCPRCHREMVAFVPAPDQREDEDSIGPRSEVPEWWRGDARISPADSSGRTHLLVKRKPGVSPSYWPAELSCHRCKSQNERAAAAWNAFMGRKP